MYAVEQFCNRGGSVEPNGCVVWEAAKSRFREGKGEEMD